MIGALTTVDEEITDKHVYQVITHWDAFSVQKNSAGYALVAKAGLDYEGKAEYKVMIRSTDNGAPPMSYDKTFTFKVGDVNEKPSDISLTPNEVSYGC